AWSTLIGTSIASPRYDRWWFDALGPGRCGAGTGSISVAGLFGRRPGVHSGSSGGGRRTEECYPPG
ncbi:MAG: hypothetical protein ACRDX8_01475, partial [Acidimicrobiales bacterium]